MARLAQPSAVICWNERMLTYGLALCHVRLTERKKIQRHGIKRSEAVKTSDAHIIAAIVSRIVLRASNAQRNITGRRSLTKLTGTFFTYSTH